MPTTETAPTPKSATSAETSMKTANTTPAAVETAPTATMEAAAPATSSTATVEAAASASALRKYRDRRQDRCEHYAEIRSFHTSPPSFSTN